MKLKCKNTARLAVTAGLCASMALTSLPTDAIAEELVPASESSISETDAAVVSTHPPRFPRSSRLRRSLPLMTDTPSTRRAMSRFPMRPVSSILPRW